MLFECVIKMLHPPPERGIRELTLILGPQSVTNADFGRQ